MAEVIARRMVADSRLEGIEVASAGTQAWDGSPASDEALLVGVERNLDLSEHRSRRLTPEIVNETDLILVMSPSHIAQVREVDPSAKVHLLSGYGSDNVGRNIADPFGGNLADYRATADVLEKELSGLLERISAA
jgi:protein-tyrosine-phosphatase